MRNWQFNTQFFESAESYYITGIIQELVYSEAQNAIGLTGCFSFFILAPITTKPPVENAFKIVQCAKVSNNFME